MLLLALLSSARWSSDHLTICQLYWQKQTLSLRILKLHGDEFPLNEIKLKN